MNTNPVRILELRSVRGTGGGPEKTILLGAQRSDRARFAVTVCYLRDARDPIFGVGRRASTLGAEYFELVERHSFDPRVWSMLRRVVRERGIDIVHAHDYKTDFLARLLAVTDGVIPLATAHGWTGRSRRERLLYYPADKQLLRTFPITIAVSDEIRRELVRVGVAPERIRVIVNGIDHRVWRRDRSRDDAARQQFGFRPNDIVIGSVGRLEQQKRFDLLIRACAELQRHSPHLKLIIAGDGSLRQSLAHLASELLPDGACRLLGHCDDVSTLYHAMDLFVQSSDYEGTPNAVLEAMAFETPVVATTAGGTAELVEEGLHALTVPCGDSRLLAAAIHSALTYRDSTEARVRAARRAVETELSFDARTIALEAVYAELVSRRAHAEAAA